MLVDGGTIIMKIVGSHRRNCQQGLVYQVGEKCDNWVGNTCRITVSEEVGKDGIMSTGEKDSLGLGEARASLSVRGIRKRW